MKHHILSRTFSMMTAALLVWSAVSSTGVLQAAAVQQIPEVSAASQTQQAVSSEPVSVIVRVNGDAVMEQPEAAEQGGGYLKTVQAAEQSARNKARQRSVQAKIRKLYPSLKVGFSYSTLFNGFSCMLPENLIEKVKALPGVVSVTKMETAEVPQMNRAAALSGFPTFFEENGCSGEGQVIAVIDSELDPTHPMFAPLAEGIETAVSREDIAEVIGSGTLNIDADPDRAYISSKIPFAVNYTAEDPYGSISDRSCYHGTHVSGIAAGNSFKTSDGTTISGIAKDAQLMFFGISGGGRSISIEAGIAALEDAVKLGADVVNMSWGGTKEYFGENPISDAILAADRAGVVVCASAGNDDNGVYSWNQLAVPENPDTCYISDKAELGSPVMLVASANNPGNLQCGVIEAAGKQIVLMPQLNSFGVIHDFCDVLEQGEYEYADCGSGTEAEFAETESLKGKIALVSRTAEAPTTIAANAARYDAAAVLLTDREEPDGMEYVYSTNPLMICAVTYEDGQALRNAEKKVLTVTGRRITRRIESAVSSYTSWGVKHSLDLRPDIMGIGGSVRSAAYDSSDMTMSGTSMSSPYVAGCTAVIRDYLKKQGIRLSGSEFAAYIRRLLMNTAVPYQEKDVFVTPRRQGAGLVSLDRAAAAKVLMTGEAGDAKINLFDRLGDKFSFPLTLTNYSSEDVTYQKAEIRLTTDGTYESEEEGRTILRGQQALRCTTDFSGPVTVAAGKAKTVTVNVTLDSAQTASLLKTFIYGFFAEGYLLLSGAENSADISIPLLGFCGDWAQIPIIPPEDLSVLIQIGSGYECTPASLIREGLIYKQILSRMPEEELRGKKYYKEIQFACATAEEKKQLQFMSDECWISPNGDSIADRVTGSTYYSRILRQYTRLSSALLDPNGDPVFQRNGSVELGDDLDFSGLKDGDYTYQAKRELDYPGSAEHPQIFACKVHIDTQKPEVTSRISKEDGRTYLLIEASDDRKLQGMAVCGNGFGFSADAASAGLSRQRLDAEILAIMLLDSGKNGTSPQENAETGALPYVLRCFAGISDGTEGGACDFADILAPEPGADGIWKVKYDITDLENYSVTVMDEAYNYVEIRSEDSSAEKMIRRTGIWLDPKKGIYEITKDKFIITGFYDGSVKEYSFTAEGGRLILTSGKEKQIFTVRQFTDSSFQLTDENGDIVSVMTGENIRNYSDVLGKPFFPVRDLLAEFQRNGSEYWGVEGEITSWDLSTPRELRMTAEFRMKDGTVTEEAAAVSLLSGRGHSTYIYSPDENNIRKYGDRSVILFAEPVTEIPQGLYEVSNRTSMMLFDKDGRSGMYIYNEAGRTLNTNVDEPFTYTIDEDGTIRLESDAFPFLGTIMKDPATGGFYITLDAGEDTLAARCGVYTLTLVPYITDPEQVARLRPTAELHALAAAYIRAVTGDPAASGQEGGRGLNYGQNLSNGAWFGLTIDPATLDCTDDIGNTGNLLDPPEYPEHAAYTPAQLKERAAAQYREQTGTAADSAVTVLRSDGLVSVLLYDSEPERLARYTADPLTGRVTLVSELRGDVNCDGSVDVSDAVLLARFCAEDRSAVITADGKRNADCNTDNSVSNDDVIIILKIIAKLIGS